MHCSFLKRGILLFGITVIAAAPGCNNQGTDWQSIHDRAIVMDGHSDTVQRIYLGDYDLGKRNATGHVDIPRMIEGGFDAAFFSIWIDPIYENRASARRTLQLIDAILAAIETNSGRIELAVNASDVRRLAQQGKLAALIGIEGGHAIEDDLGLLRMYHRLGVRYMTLTHSNTNNWCDSSGDEPRWGGLNEFGEQVVREMNRIGMIIDISHVSDEAFFDVMNLTTKPVIASHSSVRALCDVPRNMSDDMIRAVAGNGGVICVNFYSGFLDEEYNERFAEYQRTNPFTEPEFPPGTDLDTIAEANYRLYETMLPVTPPPFEKIIEHIDYIAKLVGVDHVGLGSDFDGVPNIPQGMEDSSKLPDITRALLERGYTKEEVTKILGGNFLRVLEAVTGK